MAYGIGVLSQKGGVGKSTLAQLVAHGYANNDYTVLLADMDSNQGSSLTWAESRMQSGISPTLSINVKAFTSVSQVHQLSDDYDLIVYDGAPHATAQTLEIARSVDIVLLPSNTSKYDLDPQIKLAHELVSRGLEASRIFFVFSRVVSTEKDLKNAFAYVGQTPYRALPSILEEKTGYRTAAEQGKATTETPIPSLKARAQTLFSNVSTALMKIITPQKATI